MDTKEFKSVIEDIVDAKMARKGITKFMSAVVKTVHEDGSVDVYLPPDKARTASNVLNKTGETLYEGDSVELCAKNGKLSNAWVSVKHGKQTNDTGWLYSSRIHTSDLGSSIYSGTLYGRKIGNIVELNFQNNIIGGDDSTIFILNEAFRPTQKIYAVLRITDDVPNGNFSSCTISINTNGTVKVEDDSAQSLIDTTSTILHLYGNVMYFV